MQDGKQKVSAAVRKIFDPAEIATLGHTIRKRWVHVPEWGDADVCMWGTTLGDRVRVESDVQMGTTSAQQAMRRQVATIIDCARDGDERDAKRLFEREKHWAWLEEQPASVLDPLYLAVIDADAGGSAMQELEQGFGSPEMERRVEHLENCLTYIASVSGFCTDCPQNSLQTCPLRPSTSPSPPTES